LEKAVPSSPRIAVAFGGGGARGIAHIHIVEVLDELGIRPVAIAGSSIGSIVGAGMASGMTGKEIHEYMAAIFNRRSEVAKRMWQTRPARWAELLKGGLRVSQFNIEKVLDVFLPASLPANVEELKIPMSITATFRHRGVLRHTASVRSGAQKWPNSGRWRLVQSSAL
jgi:NTE family protein